MHFGLRQQEPNADMFLESEDGTVIASMTTASTANEELPQTLLAGTYFVRVEASVLCRQSARARERQRVLTESRARWCSSPPSPTQPTDSRPAHARASGRGVAIGCARATGTARVTHDLNPRAARRVPLPAAMQPAVSDAACVGGHAGHRPGSRLRERLSYPPVPPPLPCRADRCTPPSGAERTRARLSSASHRLAG